MELSRRQVLTAASVATAGAFVGHPQPSDQHRSRQ
ncbi:twin-arginine translocation signal domain-containing protein [Frankia sp. AiPs1]|nr:twin-arginine translocation signal domain-containing protein [Frankia sp. AiPs1]MCM3920980.1 twin-arginine translocation signal domain-containing protein [Frankia sp. AiPs1]